MAIFQLARIGLWLYDAVAATRSASPPSTASRTRSSTGSRRLPADAPAAGLQAIGRARSSTLRDAAGDSPTGERTATSTPGTASGASASPRSIFRDEPARPPGPLPRRVHGWTAEETALARGFADQMASAVGNHRLNSAASSLAARLEAVQELAIRLNRTRDFGEIAELLVEGTERLIEHDSIRVYRLNHDAGMCEPVAFKGALGGAPMADGAPLRLADRRGPDRLGGRTQRDRPGRRRGGRSAGAVAAPAAARTGVDPRGPDQLRGPRPRRHLAVRRRA